MAKHSKVLILGSGPAGYTAAIYAARAMLKPILVFGSEPGGQLTTTTDVENFPGYSKVIQGPWLMEEMKGQAKAVGTEMIQDHIKKVDLSKKPFEAIGDSGQVYSADSFIIWDSVVEDVIGDTNPKSVKAIKIKNVKTNKTTELKVDGLFIAIGHDPATSLFKGQLNMDKEGYIITNPDSTITNVPGVFAAGDVKDKIFRQAVTAAGMGCMAALEAEKHLSSK